MLLCSSADYLHLFLVRVWKRFVWVTWTSVIIFHSHFIYPRFLSSVHKTVILCKLWRHHIQTCWRLIWIKIIFIFIQNCKDGLSASCKVSHGWYILTYACISKTEPQNAVLRNFNLDSILGKIHHHQSSRGSIWIDKIRQQSFETWTRSVSTP